MMENQDLVVVVVVVAAAAAVVVVVVVVVVVIVVFHLSLGFVYCKSDIIKKKKNMGTEFTVKSG